MNNTNFLASAETVSTPAVQPAIPPVPQQAPLLSTGFGYINQMLDLKICVAIIKKQKVQYSIIHFQDFNEEWMHCEVENVTGSGPGEDLVLLVQKTTPIILYMTGAVKSPFN